LGCVWSSDVFPGRAPSDSALWTVFMGGAQRKELFSLPDSELLALAKKELQERTGLTGDPTLISLTRYDKAIPQYTFGHKRRMEILQETEQRFPGLRFIGSYRGGIAVGDVVREATL